MNLNFNECSIRVLGESDNSMFLVKDICDILDIKNISHETAKLSEKYKAIVKNDTLGGCLYTINHY